ncbi:phosphoribosyltransferase-like predicted ribonucleoside biosynthesis protein [Frigoribacterium sp. PhB160]|uniref:phosphoribosyltransferase domain-containing protein n=1 Tax=Frigoribacterium sp. PhB160 TaxID=2485192 RepID=UPI000F47E42D|nr:phosphoribosyltransferase domain-containing protein [Frigoribacterium sp. PhB160]ROS62606.1 phosphoribosyltransferase-like predicted ribonucleoside biosynthesis protein [Frigoribacterium sp. PhB160]
MTPGTAPDPTAGPDLVAGPGAPVPGVPSRESTVVHERLGVRVRSSPRSLVPVEPLVGLALRRNPRRAHLLVSTVLAKHVPTVPALAITAGELLGTVVELALRDDLDDELAGLDAAGRDGRLTELAARFAAVLDDRDATGEDLTRLRTELADLRASLAALRSPHPEVATLGYAETATGLGRLVADALGSWYLHSTRHDPVGAVAFGAFEEAHSHATSHRLLPTDPSRLRVGGTVVLVDDELSTGATVVDTIRDLHARVPQARWVVAALIDLRGADDRRAFDELALELDTRVDVVALGDGGIELPTDVLARGAEVVAEFAGAGAGAGADAVAPGRGEVGGRGDVGAVGEVVTLDLREVVEPVRSERFGVDAASERVDAEAVSAALVAAVSGGRADGHGGDAPPVVVLGTEEFLSVPLAVAHALDRHLPTRVSSTTRSPIAVLDDRGYAVASSVTFRSHDRTVDGPGPRFAYNLTRGGRRAGVVVLMPEPGTDPADLAGPDGVTSALAAVADRVVVVLLPAAGA